MVRAILAVILGLSLGWAGESAKAPAPSTAGDANPKAGRDGARKDAVDQDTLDMVKAFLNIPTENLPAEHVPKFLAVDPASLPRKLRQPFLAKRVELYTMKQLAEGKKRGSMRVPEENCAIPKEAQNSSAGILKMAGYGEIAEDEERWLMEKTRCTEHDLMCEFTLQILKERARRRLFLHANDPLFALVGSYRESGRIRQTQFFGMGGVIHCASRRK